MLFICDQPQVPGGVQFVCRQTVSGVQERGCDVAVLRPKPMATQGVDYAEPAHGYPLYTSSTAAIQESLRRTLDSFMPDIVHVISVRWSVARQVNSTVKDVPWVLSIHNLPPYEAALAKCHDNDRLYYCLRNTRFAPNALMWAIGLREWGYARLVCHNSQVLCRITRYKGDNSRTIQVPLGCANRTSLPVAAPDRGSPFPVGASPRLLTVAGIVHHKGLHDYLRAIATLTDVLPKFHYLIIGGRRDDTYARYLERLARELGISSRTSFIYDATDSVKEAALKSADLYIQPSHEEGFCLAFLDAAVVVPRLLGTNVGEMPTIAKSDPLCEVAEAGDIKSLRDKTIQLLACPDCRNVIGRRYTRLLSRYSWTSMAVEMVCLYERLLPNPDSKHNAGRCAVQVSTIAP